MMPCVFCRISHVPSTHCALSGAARSELATCQVPPSTSRTNASTPPKFPHQPTCRRRTPGGPVMLPTAVPEVVMPTSLIAAVTTLFSGPNVPGSTSSSRLTNARANSSWRSDTARAQARSRTPGVGIGGGWDGARPNSRCTRYSGVRRGDEVQADRPTATIAAPTSSTLRSRARTTLPPPAVACDRHPRQHGQPGSADADNEQKERHNAHRKNRHGIKSFRYVLAAQPNPGHAATSAGMPPHQCRAAAQHTARPPSTQAPPPASSSAGRRAAPKPPYAFTVTFSNRSAITSSGRTPSACASKLSSSRWRSAAGATARTSSKATL